MKRKEAPKEMTMIPQYHDDDKCEEDPKVMMMFPRDHLKCIESPKVMMICPHHHEMVKGPLDEAMKRSLTHSRST